LKYLLDTHTLLWYSFGIKLSDRAIDVIESGDSFISIVSLWEVVMKMDIGKLTLIGIEDFSELVAFVKRKNIRILPITPQHLAKILDLPKIHKDPFDRLLISTAICEDMQLLTADKDIQNYNINWKWD